MVQKHVGGSKVSSNHTTFLEVVVPVIREVVKMEEVRRVLPGMITSGLSKRRDSRVSVKISQGDGVVTLRVRGNIATQEIFIYTSDVQATTEFVARTALNEGYQIRFDKKEEGAKAEVSRKNSKTL